MCRVSAPFTYMLADIPGQSASSRLNLRSHLGKSDNATASAFPKSRFCRCGGSW